MVSQPVVYYLWGVDAQGRALHRVSGPFDKAEGEQILRRAEGMYEAELRSTGRTPASRPELRAEPMGLSEAPLAMDQVLACAALVAGGATLEEAERRVRKTSEELRSGG